jgi:hypothetical protein
MIRRSRPVLVLSLAVLAAGALSSSAGASQQPSAETGIAPRVQVGPPSAAPLAALGLAARPRGARHPGHRATGAAPALASGGAPGAAAPAAAPAAAAPLVNFDGVSSRDSANTNFGQQFEPPDQGLCVGNGFVLEPVNSAYTVYDETGHALAGPFNVNGPFDEGLKEFTSDPRCYYDAADHTWFAIILAIGPGEETSSLDIAVNTSGDPRTLWTAYKIDTTDPHGKECPCFGDQPKLGIDAFNLYVTTDEFSILGPAFNGDQLYALALKDLVAGAAGIHFAHFSKLKIAGEPASSIQPAITTGEAPAEYFLNSIDPTETEGATIGVWALSGARTIAKGGTPTLSSLVLSSERFVIPVPAAQKGTHSKIEAGDDRMQQTQFIGGQLWGELTTSVVPPGEKKLHDGAAFFQVEPSLRKGVIGPATKIVDQGYVTAPGEDFLYPALQVTPSGNGAVVGTLTGAKRFPSAAFSQLTSGSGWGPIQVAAEGTTNYDPKAERWGDYSWAVMAPNEKAVWLATEYVPPKASQTEDGKRDWGTRVFEVPTG